MSDDLAKAAAAAMECLAVAADDDVLVLMNEETRAVAESLALAARARGRSVRLVTYPALTRDGEEPPASVAQAMVEATVIFAPTVFSLSHTQARGEATRRGARIATMPGITEALFERAVPVDYAELERLGGQIAQRLGGANACSVSSPAGTDIVLASRDGQASPTTAICAPEPHGETSRLERPSYRRLNRSEKARSFSTGRSPATEGLVIRCA